MTETEGVKKNHSVLLLDDDRFLLDMYSVKFTQAGFTVQSTLAASEAIAALKGGFTPDAILFDVVMPDVKYAGGYREMLKIAALARGHGIECSPHNPTGPVCNFASMHLMSAADDFSMLEFQLGESRLFFDVVGGRGPHVADGCFAAPAGAPGLGLTLDDALLAAHAYRPVTAGLDPRLG